MMKSLMALFLGLGLMASTAEAQSSAQTVAKWIDQTQFTGDLRYRIDWLKEDSNGAKRDPRYRHRLRARFGFQTEIEPQWSIGARISTMDGAGEPTSYNQTLDDNGSKKSVGWDLAYFQWKNDTGWMVRGGKMMNSFYTPQSSQLIFDMDYTPEGVALQTPWFVTAGYILDERALASGSNTKMEPDAWLWATQAKHSMNVHNMAMTVGAGYYHFFNIKGFSNLYTTNSNLFLGNSTVLDGGSQRYANDYHVGQLFGELQPMADRPLVFYADVIQNFAASRGNFGWLAGARYGNAVKAKTWDVGYAFRRTEADSTIAAINDSDFASGFDQAYGHILNARYALTDKIRLAFYYSKAYVGANHSDQNDRVFFDFNITM